MTRRTIYALVDPRAPETVRYVGCTIRHWLRLSQHVRDARFPNGRSNPAKVRFLRELIADGVKPRLLVIEEVLPERDPLVREQYWIQFFRERSHPLTNFERPLRVDAVQGERSRGFGGGRYW